MGLKVYETMKKVVRNKVNFNILKCLKGIGYKKIQKKIKQAGEIVAKL